ncbi:MAG: alpha/beta hydrolase, partial [Acidimicrobiales bacterium]
PDALGGVASELAAAGVHVVAPRGPQRAGDGWAWWDPDGDEAGGAARAAEVLAELFADAAHRLGIGPSRWAAVGFSQGGALALAAALRPPAGFVLRAAVCVGGFLPAGPSPAPAPGTPLDVLIAHGESDAEVDLAHAERAARLAERAGARVAFELHPGGHLWPEALTARVLSWLEGLPA